MIFVSRNSPLPPSFIHGASIGATCLRTNSTRVFNWPLSPARKATLDTLGIPRHALSFSSHDLENPTRRMGSSNSRDAAATIWGRWLKNVDGGPDLTTKTTEYGEHWVWPPFSTDPAWDLEEDAARFLVMLVKPTSTEAATAGGGGTGSLAWVSFDRSRFLFLALAFLPLEG